MFDFWLAVALLLTVPSGTLLSAEAAPDSDSLRQSVVLIIGASGADEYGSEFLRSVEALKGTAESAMARITVVGEETGAEKSDRQLVADVLQHEAKVESEVLWIVLVGHGTFDGEEAKFNLRGPDVSAQDLSEWLKPCEQPQVVVNCSSASAPFMNKLAAPGRVVVTATKSGYQYNFARFGRFFAEAIGDPAADLDKDEQTSLLEAFLLASSRVTEFYDGQGRLATEHSLIDDNGDGRGTPATWFRGIRVIRQPKEGQADGFRANQLCLIRSEAEAKLTPEQRDQRDRLEGQLEALRQHKSQLPESNYYGQLEEILLQLAAIYAEHEDEPEKES
jgi:hypothetical protein